MKWALKLLNVFCEKVKKLMKQESKVTLFVMGDKHDDEELRKVNIEKIIAMVKDDDLQYLALEGYFDNSDTDSSTKNIVIKSSPQGEVANDVINFAEAIDCPDYKDHPRITMLMDTFMNGLCAALKEHVITLTVWAAEDEELHEEQGMILINRAEVFKDDHGEYPKPGELEQSDEERTLSKLRSEHYLKSIGLRMLDPEQYSGGNILLYCGRNHVKHIMKEMSLDERNAHFQHNMEYKEVLLTE